RMRLRVSAIAFAGRISLRLLALPDEARRREPLRELAFGPALAGAIEAPAGEPLRQAVHPRDAFLLVVGVAISRAVTHVLHELRRRVADPERHGLGARLERFL